MTSTAYVAVLRGINVGGTRGIRMDRLRELCSALGWHRPRTYIQSGNIVFRSERGAPELERELEQSIADRLELDVPTIVRSQEDWSRYVTGNPFPDASRERPHLVMLALAKSRPHPDAVEELSRRAAAGERIALVGEAIWIDFPRGAGRSKITPVLLDRLVGSSVTSRNWRTVSELASMLEAASTA